MEPRQAKTSNPYPRLFEPGTIGTLRLKNRIIMPAMATQLASDTGAATQRLIEHYVRRAKGGVGLIIAEFTCVEWPRGKGAPCQLTLHDDRFLAGHANLAEAVHLAGAKISVQLHHAGGSTGLGNTEGVWPVAPSPLPSRPVQEQPRTLTTDDIHDLVELFARAVERAKTAGYDSVELHGAHGYLLGEFMSPYANTRSDDYGGSLDKRMRFPLEVITRAKELVGDDFPITMRISGREFVPGGRSLEESAEVARILEGAGLAALHVSAAVDTDQEWAVDPIYHCQGCKVDLAAHIKTAVGIPVITVGVLREPQFAEDVLAQGKADFVAIGRGLMVDPDWPLKAYQGRADEIRKCVSCNHCVTGRIGRGLSVRCIINTDLGSPLGSELLEKTTLPRRVMVVGGGPAGIEAARVAALRGHEVVLHEQGPCLGGQILLAAKSPDKDKLDWLVQDLVREFEKSPARLELNSPVDADLVRRARPDAVILATGAEPAIPPIPGADQPSVATAWAVLSGERGVEQGHVIVLGGNSTGCEVALFLARAGSTVTIVEQVDTVANDIEPLAQSEMRKLLAGHPKIQTLVGWKATEIEGTTVTVLEPMGEQRALSSDLVVLAVGVKPVKALCDALGKQGHPGTDVFLVGDCLSPRTIADALFDGRAIGHQL